MPAATAGEYTLENLREWSGEDEREFERLTIERDTSRESTPFQSFCRALVWTICSATTIYSTKQLVTTHGFHYPLTIAFRAFASVLVVYTILLRLSADTNSSIIIVIPRRDQWRWTLRRPDKNNLPWRDNLLFHKHSFAMIPASIAAASSLPILLEGLLHMPSLPVIVMLFPLVYVVEFAILCMSGSSQVRTLPWEAILVLAACVVILYNDYRLMVYGLIWGVIGIIFIGIFRALFTIGSERVGQARRSAYHGFVIMTLIFGMLISGILMIRFEMAQFSHVLSTKTIAYECFNMASFIGTAFSGTSFLAYTPISFEVPEPQFDHLPIRNLEFLPSFSSSLLVLLVTTYSDPIVVSWVQLTAYFTAAAFLLGSEQILNFISTCLDSAKYKFHGSVPSRNEPRKSHCLLTTTTLFLAIFLSSYILSALSETAINALPPPLPSNLDALYQASTRFEIVISMYDEIPEDIKTIVSAIKSTSLLNTISPQITIYTKNPSHSQPSILLEVKAQAGADRVEWLQNAGREGGTYLHHIINNWDSLAEQTMFIQAHAHNMRELISRINSYLVPETGFLSLGFAGQTCGCGSCSDRWGWEDQTGVVPGLYESIYGKPCDAKMPILLTYKGQFVASARRIRGIPKSIYSDLLQNLTSTNSSGGEEGGAGKGKEKWKGWRGGVVGEDTPDNPHFGFTVERIWGLLGQCASNQRVLVRCPSLLSGMGRVGNVEDCGCLDKNR